MGTTYLKAGENESFFRQRLAGTFALVVVAFGILILRLYYLQIIKGDDYYQKSVNNCIRLQYIPAQRGLIFDRSGELLVDNRPSFDVSIIPKDVRQETTVISKLAQYLDMPEDALISKLHDTKGMAAFQPLLIKQDVGRDVLAKIEVNRFDLPGVNVDVTPRRHYIKQIAPHLIGYLSEISDKELRTKKTDGYRQGDYIGKFGVEKLLEDYLKGVRGGRQVEVDVTGQVLKELHVVAAKAGYNVYLSIDAKLQTKAEELMKDKTGAVVAMDPNTGMILAMVSSPGFDQNQFANGMTSLEWNDLISDPRRPMLNKSIQGEYPPGSVYKIVTAIAGLEEGIIQEKDSVDCPGYYRFGNRTFRCWKRPGHGWVNIFDALSESCDVFFYQVGQQLGVDRIAQYAFACGLGSPTGLGLDPESPGIIPTSEWKKKRFKEAWQKGETLSIAIGQGFNLTTPIQLLILISGVANEGTFYKPFVIKKIETVEGKVIFEGVSQKIGELPATPRVLKIIRKGLWNVVNKPGGTAYWAGRSKFVEISGKTGTSQVIGRKSREAGGLEDKERYKPHAWFVAYAPSTGPSTIAVSVLVEHGEHGSSAAAPIAKALIEEYIGNN